MGDAAARHRPRVLHVVEAVETGVIRHVSDIVEHVPADHQVALPARRRGGGTDLTVVERLRSVAPTHALPLARAVLSWGNIEAIWRLRRLVATNRPDVLHLHSTVAGAVGRLAAVGLGVPVVYTPNGLSPLWSARLVERLLGRVADRWVAVSHSEALLASRRRLARPPRLVVVPNGIPAAVPRPPREALRARVGAAPGQPIIAAVGRLAAQKAPDVAAQAWAVVARRVPNARFVWIGDGPDRASIQALIAETGAADRIHLLGPIDYAAALLSEVTVLCLPSRYEGGPYVALEAMRAGVPVVGTDVVGIRDCVIDGSTGLLVPSDDPLALAGAIERLLVDPGLAAALGAAGRVRFLAEFTLERSAARLAALYRELSTR